MHEALCLSIRHSQKNMVRWIGIATLICLQVGQAYSGTSPEDTVEAMRKAGKMLAQPPLAPIPSEKPALITADSNIMTARFADKAGIALIQTSQAIEFVNLGTMERIFRDQIPPVAPGPLSPNGRLFTTSDRSQLSIRDTRTGAVIAQIPSVHPWEFHWLDERTAFYVDEHFKSFFIDFTSGKTVPSGLMALVLSQAVRIPGVSNQYAVLTGNKVFKFELARSQPMPELKLLAEKQISLPGLASNTSGTTSDGNYFFGTASHLTLINLRSLESEEISLEPFYFQTSMATPTPDNIIVTGFIQPPDGSPSQDYLYSISKRSLAQIKPYNKTGMMRLVYMEPLRKLGIISNNQIALMDESQTAENIPLTDFLKQVVSKSEHNKIAIAERQQALEDSCHPSKEKNKDGIELYAVGVYEGPLHRSNAPANKVDVKVYPSAQPIVLALFSYESVTWNITLDKGAKLKEVILNSSDRIKLTGANSNSIKVIRQNLGYTAYENCDFFRMVAPKLKEFSGLNTTSFQGSYRGIGFPIRPQNQPLSVATSTSARKPAPVTKSVPEQEEGLAAYERGEYRAALKKLMPLAQKGDAISQNTIGKIYMQGQEVQQDYGQALMWFRRAAGQKLPNAQNNLGVMYAGGYGVPQDFKQAIAWFEKAAAQGYVIAMNNLADIYEGGVGISKNPIAAEKWRNRAQGQAPSHIGGEVTVELGGSEDYKKGLDLYQRFNLSEAFCPLLAAAQKGHPEAQLKLESMYLKGQSGGKDEKLAEYWGKRAADRLKELAQQPRSGVAATSELPGSKDYKKGLGLYNKGRRWEAFCLLHSAAEQDIPAAQLKMQAIYQSGEGGEKDERRAQYWGKKAKAQGYSNKDGRDRIYIIDTSSGESPRGAPAVSATPLRAPNCPPERPCF